MRNQISQLHDCVLYFVKRACSGVEVRRKDVECAVKICNLCRSIDTSSVRWSVGDW